MLCCCCNSRPGTIIVALAAAGVILAGAYATTLQDTGSGQQEVSPEQQAQMQQWMEFGSPGEHHKPLAAMVGSFTAVMTMHMPGESQDPIEGRYDAAWTMGERFIEGNYHAEFWGMPMHGRLVMGYSKASKKYQMSWRDSMSTQMSMAEGVMEGNVITFPNREFNAMAGEWIDVKDVITITSKDSHTFERHYTMPQADGTMGEMLGFRIVYTRN